MTNERFARLVNMAVAAKGLRKADVGRAIGVNHQPDFSGMLGGYKKWPTGVKEKLISFLELQPAINWLEAEQRKKAYPVYMPFEMFDSEISGGTAQ
jgi:hypothetical protein